MAILQRTQPLDLAPQADELLAVHRRLLKLAQNGFVGGLHLQPVAVPVGTHLGDAVVGARQGFVELAHDGLQVGAQALQHAVRTAEDVPARQVLKRFGRQEHAVNGQFLPHGVQAVAEGAQAFGNRVHHLLAAHQQAAPAQAFFEPDLAEAFEGLFQAGQRRQPLVGLP